MAGERPDLQLAAALTAAGTVDEVIAAILDHARRTAGAELCVVAVPAGNERKLRMAVSGSSDHEFGERWAEIDLAAALPIADAISTGMPVLLGTDLGERYRDLARDRETTGIRSSASFPMSTRYGPLGGVGFAWLEHQEFTPDLLGRLGAVVQQGAQALERARFHELAQQLIEALRGELLRAELVDSPAFHVMGAYRSAWAGEPLGGDWYDALALPDGRVALIVGDVAGHGVAVAPRMVALRHISRILVLEVPDPVSCLSGLDAAIRSLEPDGVDTLVAAMIAVMDPVAGEITWANAGLPGPLVRDRDGRVERLSGGRVPLLGAGVDRTSVPSPSRPFPPGSTFVMHTDGLDPGWQESDLALSTVADWADGAIGTLVDRLVAGRPETGLHMDDAGLLVAHARAAGIPTGEGSPSGRSVGMDGVGRRFSVTLTAEPASSHEARDAVAHWLGDHPCRERVVLTVSELVSNATRHGPPGRPVEVRLTGIGPLLRLEVRQEGHAFEAAASLPMPPPDQPGGRGLPVVASLAARWGVAGDGKPFVWAEFDVPDC